MFKRGLDTTIKDCIIEFLKSIKDSELPLVNQVECAYVRIRRKLLVVNVYPELRNEINRELPVMPEMVRYVNTPTVLSETYHDELVAHWSVYLTIVNKTELELISLYKEVSQLEEKIDKYYNVSKSSVGSDERELCGGLEILGLHYKYAFKHIMMNILGKKYKLIDETFNGSGFFLQDDD